MAMFDKYNPSEIYEAAKNGASGEIAHDLMEEPINRVRIDLESGEDDFSLYGTLEYAASNDIEDKREARKTAKASFQAVSELLSRGAIAKGLQVHERGGRLLVPGGHGTPLVIGYGHGVSNDTQIHVSTDYIKDASGRVEMLPRPELAETTFRDALRDVMGTLATTACVSYEDIALKATPEHLVAVTAPEKNKTDPKSKTRKELETPESISDDFGAERPQITFAEIGGQEAAKREIEGLAFAISNPDLYEKWGTKPPKGVLLYGPPGTGKTLMAKALASQAEASFYSITPTDITSKWYGEAEKRILEIFDKASEDERAIIYFDEIDSVIPERGDAHEATQRSTSVILQKMDGMGSQDNVMVVGSSNRKDGIDPAMLRPGRLDKLIEVGLPDQAGRQQIFDIHMTKANDMAKRNLFETDATIETIASETENISGADIAEIIRRVLEEKVREEGWNGAEPPRVSKQELLNEYAKMRATSPSARRPVGFKS